MLKITCRLAPAAVLLFVCLAAAQQPSSDAIRIPFETYSLPNGLTVILSADHSTPTVAVAAWYHVGSKNETQGRTGFAHLFEHVMFTGSGHVPYGLHDKLTEGVGGTNNGTTSNDRTVYFETVPGNYLESALWIESDRMGYLLDTLDIGKLNAQRDIVKNERRQRTDNQPYGRAEEILAQAVYPPTHPYSWPVIGSMTDLSAASEEDVKNFFRTYYAPNNVFLSIAGDFDAAQAKAWVTKYFGDLPRGKPISRPTVRPVTLDGEKRLVYEDRVQIPRLYVVWPTVGRTSDDRFALQLLAAITAGPRTARLSQALVYDQQAAASVTTSQDSNEDVGEFLMTITPRPGHSLAELELAADAILERLKTDGPTAEEIQRATAGLELAFVTRLQSNLAKAQRLADGAGFHNDPGYYQTEYAKSLAVTAEDVKRVANKYLTGGRVVLSIVPMGKPEQAARQTLDRTKIPPPGRPPVLSVPAWTRSKLANGADLVVSEKHDLPLVSFTITFLGGSNQFDAPERAGIGSVVASMMSEGTATRDGDALSNALQRLGASINTSMSGETGSISFLSTTGNFAPMLDVLADMLVNSTFPAGALERLRGQRLVALSQARDRTGAIAGVVFPGLLYGDGHPYGRSPTERSIKAITRDEVAAFHKEYFQPGRAIVTVAGDVAAASVKPVIERALAAWKAGGGKPAFAYPTAPARLAAKIYLVDKPGAAQSTFALGNSGPPRTTADYFALQVMNRILGGQFQSRLNANIREDKGYSYGVNSSFAFGKGPGPFRAGGDVVTASTDAALVEFMEELRGIGGARPVTDEELTTAKDGLIQRLPDQFASVAAINGAITELLVQGLPEDYYHQYARNVSAVTRQDVVRVAKQYIDLDHLAIVIVGDRATIEAPLLATGIAPIVLLDIDGNPQEKQ